MRPGHLIRPSWIVLAALCLLAALVYPSWPDLSAQAPVLRVRITSPLGRTGSAGSVRIVAQVQTLAERALVTVKFHVDGKLIQTVSAPPYAAEWFDDNPFIERVITVEATDALGNSAKDTITLKALAVNDEAGVMAISVEVAVFNKSGRFVPNLDVSAFTLLEDGVPQSLEFAGQTESPVTFALLIDSSQSMAYSVEFVRSAARRLSAYMKPKDRVIVAPFAAGLLPLTGPTNDQKTMLEAIGAYRNAGGTAILDSLSQLAQRMSDVEGRRAIVLVTDGYDENSVETLEATIKAVQKVQATVYVVGIGGIAGVSLKGRSVLKQLATETGGRTFFPWRPEDLSEIYDSLAVDVQTRYFLAYTPTNQAHDGRWRAIDVTTSLEGTVTQSRRGYFATEPPPIRPTLEFTLSDAEHRYFDVTVDDLAVFEDGVEQKIESFQEAVAPISVVLALDASGSMRSAAQTVIDAARGFVGALRPKDSLGVLMFADRSRLMQDLSTARDPSLAAIGEYKANGGTALYDGLADAFIRLKSAEGRRAVVVVTDGRDEDNPGTGPGSVRKFDEVLQLQRESGALVYGVGVGAKVDKAPLETLARVSGGQAYFPVDASALAEQYQLILENLRRRFNVSYSSTNPARNGAWRKVEIRVKSSNLVVASAGGYFAPAR